ncbi:hypothetical protein Ciccas_004158 [Cichlidogyrus casuarinus]|uniref:Uncharacterized protein n=1 Tax=Cichlidogyrus casuarinus TaxID=1844966 RepID=A0ABD2QD81_9PLAT
MLPFTDSTRLFLPVSRGTEKIAQRSPPNLTQEETKKAPPNKSESREMEEQMNLFEILSSSEIDKPTRSNQIHG